MWALKKRNKRIKFIIIIIVILAVFSYGFRYAYLNNKYPSPTIQQYNMHESINYKDATLTVMSRSFMSDEEMEKYYKDDLSSSGLIRKCLKVNIKIENKTQTDMKIDISNLVLEAPAYTNGINLGVFLALNEKNSNLNPKIKAGQTIILQLPYDLLEYSFNSDTWENIEKIDFKLVFSLYPIKKDIQL